jgi:hypothetical protein
MGAAMGCKEYPDDAVLELRALGDADLGEVLP